MMTTHPICFALDQQPALVRSFRSLTLRDAEIVAQLVDALGGGWSVQSSDDYDGCLFLLIEPSAERAEQMPSFMVSGKIGRIELAIVEGDDCRTLGCFGDMYGLVEELALRVLDAERQC